MTPSLEEERSLAACPFVFHTLVLGLVGLAAGWMHTLGPMEALSPLWVMTVAWSLALATGGLAWGIGSGKSGAWTPAMGLALLLSLVFPIGTFISYHAIRRLLRLREVEKRTADA